MSATGAPPVPPTPQESDPDGRCQVVVDLRTETVCNDIGAEEIIVRNDFGRYVVMLCEKHRVKHREFYQKRRAARPQRRTRRRSQPRGDTP